MRFGVIEVVCVVNLEVVLEVYVRVVRAVRLRVPAWAGKHSACLWKSHRHPDAEREHLERDRN